MQVLITNGPNVIEKRGYGGDTSDVISKLDAEGVSYQVFADDDPIFLAAKLTPIVTPEMTTWNKLSTLDDKVAYLAKKLGLQ